MSLKKLGALAGKTLDVTTPARMTLIDVETERPMMAETGELDANQKPVIAECYIDFMSPDSEAGRKLDRIRTSAAFRKMRSGRNRIDDDDDPIDLQVETLCALATGWFFGHDADSFSKEAAATLFGDPEFAWLRKKAYTFVYAEINFIKRSSKSSAPSPSTNSSSPAGAQTVPASAST